MATQTDPGHRPEATGATGAAATDAQAKAQQAAGQAQEKAQAAAGQAQAKMREQLDQRSSQLAEQAHQQASDLRSVSEALRDQGKDRPAQAVDRLAGYAEQAGSYLRDYRRGLDAERRGGFRAAKAGRGRRRGARRWGSSHRAF